MNVVLLRGTLHGESNDFTLATGQLVRTWELATESSGVVEKVPVRWVDPNKSVRSYVDGDAVVIAGSIQRRFFRAGGATASRTEVLGHKVVKASRTRAVENLLIDVRELIE